MKYILSFLLAILLISVLIAFIIFIPYYTIVGILLLCGDEFNTIVNELPVQATWFVGFFFLGIISVIVSIIVIVTKTIHEIFFK